MDKYFIRYEAPWGMAYRKYRVVKTNKGYAIQVKPSWKRKRILDSSTFGKYHNTEGEAFDVLHTLAERYKRSNHIEWQSEAEKEGSRYDAIRYKKWKRRTAWKEGVNEQLVEGRYDEYRKTIDKLPPLC